jgi:hypothetical protein
MNFQNIKIVVKFKTIWHYAIAFFESEGELEQAYYQIEGEPYYKGEIEKLTYTKASKIAQIHPSCLKYYEAAMMPLFQGKGKFASGTESPVLALESLKTKSESEKDMPYIMIWKIYK